MAYVINPDGTISTLETTHDQYGNLKPKIDSEASKDQETHFRMNTTPIAKRSVIPKSASSNKRAVSNPVIIRRQIFQTVKQIDSFLKRRLKSGKWLEFHEFLRIKNTLTKELRIYFSSKYEYYQRQINEFEEAMKRKGFYKSKVQKKKNKNKKKIFHQVKEIKVHHNSRAGFTIGEIATIGSLKEKYASSQDFEVRTSKPPRPSRAPKYGFARDRYGRVQERDSYNEDRHNEFYNAQNQQRHYDYSSYDKNDDHDGTYNDFE